MRRGRAVGGNHWLVVTVGAVTLGVATPGLASASCAGPVLGLGQSSAVWPSYGPLAAVRRGKPLVVSGKWFRDYCADTIADTIAYTVGCDPQPTQTETERPLQASPLRSAATNSSRVSV